MDWLNELEIGADQVSEYSSDEEETESLTEHEFSDFVTKYHNPVKANSTDSSFSFVNEEQVGFSSVQGSRSSMEDTLRIVHDFTDNMKLFVGVYDGHGGSACVSEMLANNFHDFLLHRIERDSRAIEHVMVDSFLEFDLILLALARDQHEMDECKSMKRTKSTRFKSGTKKSISCDDYASAGSTATICLLNETSRGSLELIVGWVGDSRAVLKRGNHTIALTCDHKPSTPLEKERIVCSGGVVDKNGLLNRSIGVSRAFGSFEHKTHAVTGVYSEVSEKDRQHENPLSAIPEWTRLAIENEDKFIIIATDGLWSVMTNEEATNIVAHSLMEGDSSDDASRKLAASAAKAGSRDNITVVVIRLDLYRMVFEHKSPE